jgi:hypothetical protein
MKETARNGIPEGLASCLSPLCAVSFRQTGMKIKPRRYCCDACKLDVWAIRRAAKLLEGLSDDAAIEIMRANR